MEGTDSALGAAAPSLVVPNRLRNCPGKQKLSGSPKKRRNCPGGAQKGTEMVREEPGTLNPKS